jgi:hypothetical protein
MALCWGVAATSGIGLVLGVLLALVAHSGTPPPHPVSQLIAPIVRLLGIMAVTACTASLCGFLLAQRGMISLPAEFAEAIPLAQHQRFMAAWFAHGGSYLSGLVGGGVLIFRLWRARGRASVIALLPRSRIAVLRALLVTALAAYVLWLRFTAQ